MEEDECGRFDDASPREFDERANRIRRGEITIMAAGPGMAAILKAIGHSTATTQQPTLRLNVERHIQKGAMRSWA